ncbi:MAG: PTS fructose transporter subunit IIB [Bacillota bacterium]
MKIVAVVATTEGVENTKLTVSNLEQAAMVLGVDIKVESQGASGVRNPLDEEDIDGADAVIVAKEADAEVDMDRFKGKPLKATDVMDAAHNAVNLIQEAEKGGFEPFEG